MTGTGQIGVGVVIKDSFGIWCSGFSAYKGKGLVLEAETWGLQLASNLGCDQHSINCDSAILVEMVNKGLDDLHPLKTMILIAARFSKMVSLAVLFNMCIEKPTWLLTLFLSIDFVMFLEWSTSSNLLLMSLSFCWMIWVTVLDLGR